MAPALALAQALQSQSLEPEGSEDVVQLAMRTLVVRRAPIVENGQLTGALLVCRDPATIQRADRHLRANRSLRGAGVRWRIEDYAGDSGPAQRVRRPPDAGEVAAQPQRLRRLQRHREVVDAVPLIAAQPRSGKFQSRHQINPGR